jgi:hypothetical protein
MSDDRIKSAEAEVYKLLEARIIREVQYPVWVVNVVMVPKKNGSMCMCIDFTELNKACPKDPYCRAYSPYTHARKEEDGLLLEFPCNPTRTRFV